ncbi:MazG nucleotide pyrophosphohydrolase domain-containing protein [Rothia halotolerans]|uniref:MazG nucleotide pyrophosphohydrolase domain-containing protein n=1 Tax=Rothia halotolerans TaxID=405770 RepID=UPI001EDEFB6A|nr:MazG nucleotide pyrophosphohydrolase domain-containing protein [Rothia halotolerans]
MSRAGAAFERLVELMDGLRSPGGCPWDGEQTHRSLVRYLIEESYEVVEAIEAPDGVDRTLLREELGDVLLQVVFHSRIAEETPAESGGFDVAAVVEQLNAKLVRRHPHVFGDEPDPDAAGEEPVDERRLERLTRRWDAIKREEKPERSDPFDGIPPALPALALAEKTLSKAAKAGLPLPAPAPIPAREDADSPGARPDAAETAADAVAGRPDADDAAAGPTGAASEPRPSRPLPPEPGSEISPESVAAAGREEAERLLGEELLALAVRARTLGVDPERALRGAVRRFTATSRPVGKV